MTDRNSMDDVVGVMARAIEGCAYYEGGSVGSHGMALNCSFKECAERILADLSNANLVLAPREATEEMKRAAAGHGLAFPDEAGEIWSAMISASQSGKEG